MKNFLLDTDNIDIRPVVGGVLLFVQGVRNLITECRDFAKLEEGVQKLSIREYVLRSLLGFLRR